ncbi:MAG: hypothetical protein Q7R87_04080 [Nanoarchaeota archaeon]|nr:hypothetical protein [Nanoarchaeota archaeon]
MLFQISITSSISINEIELNPADSDAGNEWIELYSENLSNLDGFYLENEDGDIFNLNGTIEGYLVINFQKQWLDNSKVIIYLKQKDNTMVQTPELSDSKNNNLTFSKCPDSFILSESSKGKDNICQSEKIISSKQNQDNLSQIITDDKIFLNKKQNDLTILSKDAKVKIYLSYFFAFLSLLLIILIYLRKL